MECILAQRIFGKIYSLFLKFTVGKAAWSHESRRFPGQNREYYEEFLMSNFQFSNKPPQ